MARIIDTDNPDGSVIGSDQHATGDVDRNGFIDPTTASGDGSGGTRTDRTSGDPPRRRGRKPGSGNRAKTVQGAALSNLETILFNASGLLAGICERKDFRLEQAEAKALADATNNVARHYAWLSGISERGQDWFNLFMITGVIIGARWNNPNASKTPTPSGTVVQFPAKISPQASSVATTTAQASVSGASVDASPTNAINLTMDDLYSVEIPPSDGPVQ